MRRSHPLVASLFVVLVLGGHPARAEDRLPTIAPAQYNDEQKQAAAEFLTARKVPVFGPFEPLMHSPR